MIIKIIINIKMITNCSTRSAGLASSTNNNQHHNKIININMIMNLKMITSCELDNLDNHEYDDYHQSDYE